MEPPGQHLWIPVWDYDLAATFRSGQVFRWECRQNGWEGVVRGRWVRLEAQPDGLNAWTAEPLSDWQWLREYLQTEVNLGAVLEQFPDDPAMRASVAACRGLRLLRQEPWECLASFILSANKQIVQIQQIIRRLCERHGQAVPVPPGHPPAWAFPTPDRVAAVGEAALRACGMGFRAPHLARTAGRVARGAIDLDRLVSLPLERARQALLELPGVGPKIADCVLLFAGGFQEVFPVDTWIRKALREFYFAGRRPRPAQLRHFATTHFGPCAGYAQQYLFHSMRLRERRVRPDSSKTAD